MTEPILTQKHTKGSKGRYFLAGLVALIPLWITVMVIGFLFRTLSELGSPIVAWLAGLVEPGFPRLATLVGSPVFQSLVSFLLVVLFIYSLGWLTTFVIGRRLLAMIEAALERLPIVRPIYGSMKRLVAVLQEKPGDQVARVVLIDFPSSEMKTVGLVTRTFKDDNTGREVAAVYVPTTPVPTSGYLEIVPVDRITPTSWTIDEAMAFIVSGGAVAPGSMPYDGGGPKSPRLER